MELEQVLLQGGYFHVGMMVVVSMTNRMLSNWQQQVIQLILETLLMEIDLGVVWDQVVMEVYNV
jgi:hypothetical protein